MKSDFTSDYSVSSLIFNVNSPYDSTRVSNVQLTAAWLSKPWWFAYVSPVIEEHPEAYAHFQVQAEVDISDQLNNKSSDQHCLGKLTSALLKDSYWLRS